MKAAPLLVSWHNDNTPIYSAHFESHGKGRLATAGGDNNVRVRRQLQLHGKERSLTSTAVEGRGQRRGAQSKLSSHPRETHAGSKRGAMGPERYLQHTPSFLRLLTARR